MRRFGLLDKLKSNVEELNTLIEIFVDVMCNVAEGHGNDALVEDTWQQVRETRSRVREDLNKDCFYDNCGDEEEVIVLALETIEASEKAQNVILTNKLVLILIFRCMIILKQDVMNNVIIHHHQVN